MGAFLMALMAIYFISSCSRKLHVTDSTREVVVYPPPPDTARIQYLTSISNSAQITKRQSAFKDYVVGKGAVQIINKPYGIHARKGKIYICDVDLKGLEIIDLTKNSFEYFIPTGYGSLKLPINCFTDDRNFLYVADAGRMQIVVFDQNLKYVNAIGGEKDFKPSDVFVANEKIWVANIKGGIHVYDQNTLQILFVFPKYEPGEKGNIYQPTNLWVTEEDVYVSDFGEFNVKVFSLDGKYKRTIGSYGSLLGQFVRPKGIAVDKESNLYVVDGGFEICQVFNKEGALMMHFGGPYKGPGDMWLPVKVTIDYENGEYFKKYVDPRYEIDYLVFVTNQYGPDKVNVYGFIKHGKN